MTVKQLSIFIENQPGRLSALTELLHNHNIDIRALSIAEVEDYGILRIIVSDVYNASTVLKNADYVFNVTPVLAVPLKDEAGGLAEVAAILGANNINIEYMYAFTARRKDKAYVVMRVKETEKAIEVLVNHKYTPVCQQDLNQDLHAE